MRPAIRILWHGRREISVVKPFGARAWLNPKATFSCKISRGVSSGWPAPHTVGDQNDLQYVLVLQQPRMLVLRRRTLSTSVRSRFKSCPRQSLGAALRADEAGASLRAKMLANASTLYSLEAHGKRDFSIRANIKIYAVLYRLPEALVMSVLPGIESEASRRDRPVRFEKVAFSPLPRAGIRQ